MSDLVNALLGLQKQNAERNVYYNSGRSLQGAFAPVDPRWSGGEQIAYSLMTSAVPGILQGIGRRQIENDNLQMQKDLTDMQKALYSGESLDPFAESKAYRLAPILEREKFMQDIQRKQEEADWMRKQKLGQYFSNGKIFGEDGSISIHPDQLRNEASLAGRKSGASADATNRSNMRYAGQIAQNRAFGSALGQSQAQDMIEGFASDGQGELIEASPRIKQEKLNQAVDTIVSTRKELMATDAYKDFYQRDTALKAIIDAAVDPSAVSDQQFVRYGIQAIEPGMAVREGEAAALEGSQSIPEQLKGVMRRVMDGKAGLGPEARHAILRLGQRYHEANATKLHQLAGVAEGDLNARGINRRDLQMDLLPKGTFDRPELPTIEDIGGAIKGVRFVNKLTGLPVTEQELQTYTPQQLDYMKRNGMIEERK